MDVAQEFLHFRIHRLARILADVEILLVGQRILAAAQRLEVELHVLFASPRRDRQRLGCRGEKGDARIADAEGILAHRVDHLLCLELGRAVGVLVVGEFDQLLVPFGAPLKHQALERQRDVVPQVVAEDVNRLLGPFAGEAELAPGADVLLGAARHRGVPLRTLESARALRSEDTVQLLDGQLRERVVLVDEDSQRIAPAGHVEAAGDHGDFHRPGAVVALVEQHLVRGDVPHRRDVRHSEGERGHACQGCFQLVLECDFGMVFLEALFPHLAQGTVGEIVRSPLADHARDLLLRRVRRQVVELPLLGVVPLAAAQLEFLLTSLLHLERIADLRIGDLGRQSKRRKGDHQRSQFRHPHSSFFNCARMYSAGIGE